MTNLRRCNKWLQKRISKFKWSIVVFVLSLIILCSCIIVYRISISKDLPINGIEATSKIEVYKENGTCVNCVYLKTITDKDVIRKLVSFTKDHHKDFIYYKDGSTLPVYELRFYAGNSIIISYGIGRGYLTQDILKKKLQGDEEKYVLRLLDVLPIS